MNNPLMFVLVILIGGGALAFVLLRERQKTNQMIARGIAVKRSIYFYKHRVTFITNVGDLTVICNAINQSVLNEMKIFSEPNCPAGWIKFGSDSQLWTFEAVLETGEMRNDRNTFNFQFLSWHGPSGELNRHGVLAANVLLTAIEKAFIALDASTGVEQERLKIR